MKSSWKVQNNREDAAAIGLDSLLQARVFVIAGPREKFTETEINHLKKYLETGGALLVLLGEGGEKRFDTNINFFLEEYGIMINSDAVVRTNYHKYFHPKVVIVFNIMKQNVSFLYKFEAETKMVICNSCNIIVFSGMFDIQWDTKSRN